MLINIEGGTLLFHDLDMPRTQTQPSPTMHQWWAFLPVPGRQQGTASCGHGAHRCPGETQLPRPSYTPPQSCCSDRAVSSGCTCHTHPYSTHTHTHTKGCNTMGLEYYIHTCPHTQRHWMCLAVKFSICLYTHADTQWCLPVTLSVRHSAFR